MKSPVALLLQGIARNVRAGTRLALFMRVSPLDFRVSPADFAALFAFNALLTLLADVVREGVPGTFNTAALPALLSQVPLLLLACLAVAAILGRRDLLLALAVALMASDPLFELVGLLLQLEPAASWFAAQPWLGVALAYAFIGWGVVTILRALVVTSGWRAPRSAYAAGVLMLLLIVFLLFMPRSDLWVAVDAEADEDAAAQASIADEPLFHRQQTLLDEALDDLLPERRGVDDLYFVGVGPYASQDVFAREVSAVRKLFDNRFGTDGRSIALLNSPESLQDTPIATATNLRTTLEQLGRIMNPDEDVLFLFITTHGDERHELSFDLPPLNLQQLTPTALARMLNDSGIKWKVLVVSACYSGGFIEPLKDANTVVITAADERSTSFGCQNGRDFTYFGRAYFKDGLSGTVSFTEAFEQARRSVTELERSERLTPSNPQMYVGAAIRDKLASLEKRLAALR